MGGQIEMELKGRVVNSGNINGEAIVIEKPFSFTADFDPNSGTLTIKDHPLFGQKIAKKILVFPIGTGAVNAAIGVYRAHKQGNAPIGIICRKADPITVECAMTINISLMDSFDKDPIENIKTGSQVRVLSEEGTVIVE
jgi:predicted aconitase with swiveling domain